MADEIAALKQLQAGLNAAFDDVYAANDAKSLAVAKQSLVGLGHATAGAALGPAFSIISLSALPVHYMAVKIATDLNVFDLVASKPHTLEELAQATKADARLLKRVLRIVTAIGWLKQAEADKYEVSAITQVAAFPPFKNWLSVHFDSRMHVYAEFPDWLKRHDYKTSWQSDTDNVWKEINGEDCWSYMASHPEYSAKFDSAMSLQESFPPEMTPPYPFPDALSGLRKESDAVTLVDVGGGAGQAIDSIKKAYADLPGKFIVQDLPKSIESISSDRAKAIGFEPQAHDFFTEQPVKGAKYYHLRRVLHDWNDEKCLEILAATRPALDPSYSKLLLVEFVLSDVNPGLPESQIDLLMMTTCDGAERSESEWHALLGKAGFRIDRILRADVGATAVIEASVA